MYSLSQQLSLFDRYTVILGRQYVQAQDEQCPGYQQEFRVSELSVHPQFNKRMLTNDIALLWITSSFNQTVKFTDYVLPVCLPLSLEGLYQAGSYGTVSGWGLLNETQSRGSNSLQHVSLPLKSHSQCHEAYGKFVDMDETIQFCAGNDKGQDACAGDSGGPFVLLKDHSYYLIGIVSYGRGCARPEYPGVYTKVTTYLPWINSKIASRQQNADLSVPEPDQEIQMTSTTTVSTTTTTITTTTPTTTTTTAKPSLNSGVFCHAQYSLLRCPGTSTVTVVSAIYALDTFGYCGLAG